jgi:hypothetical protein
MIGKVSYSHDGIKNKKLKSISKTIYFPLSHLINISIALDYSPVAWKTAKLVPLRKVVKPLKQQIIGQYICSVFSPRY